MNMSPRHRRNKTLWSSPSCFECLKLLDSFDNTNGVHDINPSHSSSLVI